MAVAYMTIVPETQERQQRAGPTAGKGSSRDVPHRAIVRRNGNGTARKLVYTKAAAAAAEGATIVATIAAPCLRFCRRQLNLGKVLKLEPHMNTVVRVTASISWAKKTATDS